MTDTRPMRDRIGFYVHHEGMGHLRRTAAIIGHLDRPVSVLTSLTTASSAFPAGTDVITLPPDVRPDIEPRDPRAGGALHWAPLTPELLGPRVAAMVDWLNAPDVALLVSDVSVETALLARLCGVATVVVRQNGDRTDDAHALAHRIAHGILAPFPEELEAADTPPWVRAKSFYGGFISAAEQCGRPAAQARRVLGLDHRPALLVLLGAGEHGFDIESLHHAECELGSWQIIVTGPLPPGKLSGSIRIDGWVSDPTVHLAAVDVVIGTAGSNVVADVATAARPLICVPEQRPFDEQHQRAARLADLGAAVVSERWPQEGEWAELVAEALALGPTRLAQLSEGATPERAARWIAESADAASER